MKSERYKNKGKYGKWELGEITRNIEVEKPNRKFISKVKLERYKNKEKYGKWVTWGNHRKNRN